MELQGVTAAVTGGASGLGAATAAALAERGAKVFVLDLPGARDRVDPARATFVECDVTQEAQVEGAIAQAAAEGSLRVCVNCAGVGWAERTLARNGSPAALEPFRKVIEVNLIGTFTVIRAAAAAMAATQERDGERGVIVNTASVAAYDGQIGQAAYSASKGGIVGMTLPIARDLAASLIRCVTIAPRSPSRSCVAAIAAAAARITVNVPIRFTSITFRNGSSAAGEPSRASVRSAQPTPAQLTQTRRSPSAAAWAIAVSTCSPWVTSHSTKVARSGSTWSRALGRSSTKTLAPRSASAAAVAAPRPDAPPVTAAVTPSSSITTSVRTVE